MSILWPRLAKRRLSSRTAAATPPTLGSSVWTICKIFSELDNETFRPLKIFVIGRESFNRARRNAAVKLIRFGKSLVHERFGADHAKIRQDTASKQNAIGSDETVIANPNRERSLAIPFNVEAVGHDLRLNPGEGAEFANGDRIRAIDKMPMGNGGMFAHDQLRLAIGFVGEVAGWPEWKTGDPVAAADHGMRFEMQQIETLTKRQMIDPAPLLHDQPGRINPGQTDAATWMDLIAKLFFQKRTAQRPRQKEAEKHQDLFHNFAPRLR